MLCELSCSDGLNIIIIVLASAASRVDAAAPARRRHCDRFHPRLLGRATGEFRIPDPDPELIS